mmetsp:Transcript_11492/g.27285  ORF Transcript_11492/g.27285 Transcript_11492/m.27285 type:complete len:209 (-) Transcript_11492:382-1008(-)
MDRRRVDRAGVQEVRHAPEPAAPPRQHQRPVGSVPRGAAADALLLRVPLPVQAHRGGLLELAATLLPWHPVVLEGREPRHRSRWPWLHHAPVGVLRLGDVSQVQRPEDPRPVPGGHRGGMHPSLSARAIKAGEEPLPVWGHRAAHERRRRGGDVHEPPLQGDPPEHGARAGELRLAYHGGGDGRAARRQHAGHPPRGDCDGGRGLARV